jgi:hypothetical protein
MTIGNPALSVSRQIAKCRAKAMEAERLALTATGPIRDSFVTSAKQWYALASRMERELD